MSETTERKKIAVVGAGVAGLATARVLLAQGHAVTLFERSDRLGGVWAGGYSNFGVQVQAELYEFPDWPLPEGTPDFTPGPIVQKYLCDFADHFGIAPHIRFEHCLIELAECEGPGSGWRLRLKMPEGEEEESFDLVVLCIGLYSNQPNMPSFPDEERFNGKILHISDLKTRAPLADKRVAVLGYGKSATDAAVESAAVAKETHIILREAHWPLPAWLAGILPVKWGLFNRLTSALIPHYQNPTPVEKVVQTLGRPLAWFYWRLVELLIRFQFRLGSSFGRRVSLVPKRPVEVDAFGESTMLPRPDFYRLLRRGIIDAHVTTVAGYRPEGVTLGDGSDLEVEVMVLATGWKTDFSFFTADVWQRLEPSEDGFYLYRHILHPAVPGLFFIGRASSVSSILTYSLQARWLGELLAGRFQLPAAAEMADNIAAMRDWKRAWIPFSSARSARLIAHTQHYHDELLRDFGVSPWRKRGVFAPLKEVVAPYEPKDYAQVVAVPEEQAART